MKKIIIGVVALVMLLVVYFVFSKGGFMSDREVNRSIDNRVENSVVEEKLSGEMELEATFSNGQNGSPDEIYTVVSGLDIGEEVTVELYGGGNNGNSQVKKAGEDGRVYFSWVVSEVDKYSITAFSASGKRKSVELENN